MSLLSRLKSAAKVLTNDNTQTLRRQNIPPITLEEVQEIKQFFPREKYFIFGHARSGTTLLTRLIRLHPEVYCNYQAHFFTRSPLLKSLVDQPEIEEWLKRPSNRWNRGKDLSPIVLRAAADIILEREAVAENKRIVGDKSPNTLLNGEAVRLLHDVYPDAKLVCIVRDGRDAAISQRFKNFVDTVSALPPEDMRIRQELIDNSDEYLHGKKSLFTAKGIRLAAEGWKANVIETDQIARELYGSQYIWLRYEDMLKDTQREMKRLWEFLGADVSIPGLDQVVLDEMTKNPDAEWQQKKANEVTAGFQKGKRGSWREIFTPRDRQVFHDIAGSTLKTWGYDED